ncbi:TPR domain protein [Aspergillus foveolatus]|uniref:TPR domain protein n=1 Tax=Aspergillus foveolatus TaxID=210207 RepID=UPI003CCE2546
MDVRDVSSIEQYVHLLKDQERTLRNSQSHRGQSWKTTKPRGELIKSFWDNYIIGRQDTFALPDTFKVKTSFLPPAYPPCTAHMADLKKVAISDLRLETHHRGSYILLRAVTPVSKMTGIMVIVEDEASDVLLLQLYNQEEQLVKDGCLVEGTIPLAWRQKDTEFDISANDWKLKGNKWFDMGNYHLANDCYSRALESSPSDEEAITIRLNRALSSLRAHEFEAALRDLDIQPTDPKSLEKALFRKAQALYHLGRFRESCETHEILARQFPENTVAKTEFSPANARVAEQQKGKYQFKRMQREAAKRVPPQLDHATYVGPVAVKMTDSRGRGLFTTDAVKAGDLLFCEKAFAHTFHDAKNPKRNLSLLLNLEAKAMTIDTQARLMSLLVQKLYTRIQRQVKSFGIFIMGIDGLPVVDTFLVERAMSLNCFGCPASSRESHIESIRVKGPSETGERVFESCGIWPLASYINHSCDSNARRSFIGDMMVVRATRDIPDNTELTFWYESPLIDGPAAKAIDLRHWGFKCSCIICTDIAQTNKNELKRGRTLLGTFKKLFDSPSRVPGPRRLEALLSREVKQWIISTEHKFSKAVDIALFAHA